MPRKIYFSRLATRNLLAQTDCEFLPVADADRLNFRQ